LNVGDRIKFFRIQQRITQETLADGIISKSYLSKIENGTVEPSEEVINLLLNRLGLKKSDKQVDPGEAISEIDSIYKEMLIKGISEELDKRLNELKLTLTGSQLTGVLILFDLLEFRYYLGINDMTSAEQSRDNIKSQQHSFNYKHEYFFNKFSGILEYKKGKYDDAFKLYKECETALQSHVSTNVEKADLLYQLGLTTSQLWRAALCISYTNQALTLYNSEYNLKRCAECHILLGISYRRNSDFEKARESYSTAAKIGVDIDVKTVISLGNHNLGYLESDMGNQDEAINYFKMAIESHKEDRSRSLISVYCLVKEYYHAGDYENGIEWAKRGLEWAEEDSEYYYRLEAYRLLLIGEGYEVYIRNVVLPYFNKKKNNKMIHEYSEILADYYMQNIKYKDAYVFQKKSTEALKRILNV
jgi:transcriptional regulator with XRE-family HTH domain